MLPSSPEFSPSSPTGCLAAATAAANALLVGDNGSERATGIAWVEALDPRLALISVGVHYGPAPQILDRLAGRAVLRTDLQATLTLFTDGN
jgi:beta-lactamase superfamily II metal-dependent hydrolase